MISSEPDQYDVEKILNKKYHDGKLYYKVKWVGYDEPTWEAEENCTCDQLIEEFENKLTERLDYEEDNEWEVEAILNKRIHKSRVEYLIKWRGWPGEPTWEIADNCECINLIAAFENPKLKKMWGFKGSNRNLWVGKTDMLDYMKNYLRATGNQNKINLLKFEPDFPENEKQLPLKEGLNVVCDPLNTLIGTRTMDHPVVKRLKRAYTQYPVKPIKMTQMDRSDVCAFYTLAAFERAIFLYNNNAQFVAENIFFDAPRAELIRGRVKPESDGEISVALPLPPAFDHGPMCEFCEKLLESNRAVDEHINRRHMRKRIRTS